MRKLSKNRKGGLELMALSTLGDSLIVCHSQKNVRMKGLVVDWHCLTAVVLSVILHLLCLSVESSIGLPVLQGKKHGRFR